MGTDNAEAVDRAMHGDHDAFAALIGTAVNRLYALACLILRDADRAEDAAQEAIVRAWRELPRLRDPDKFDAWLRRLTVTACFDEARRVRRRAEVSLLHLDERTIADPTGATVEHDRVDRAFRRLPFDQRTVLVLQHQFDLTHSEIADTLGIPIGTVKSRIRYGSAALRASLEADDRSPLAAADRTSA
jgi:RNA polymerase sigma-70 factor (ECF subfamily)